MRVAVVGSGVAGMAASRVLLDAGHRVDVIDVGHVPEPSSEELAARIRAQVESGARVERSLLRELKWGPGEAPVRGLRDALGAILGGSVAGERVAKRILGSRFVFEGVEEGIPLTGATVPRSLARGGLSNVWGAACYPLREIDYAGWPLNQEDLAPWYERAAEMMSLLQPQDDLARSYPLHGSIAENVPRNSGSVAELLLAHWERQSDALAEFGWAAGRARLAVRPSGSADDACRECGLCFYGCPFGSIYVSGRTIDELSSHERFAYRTGLLVHTFAEHENGVEVRARRVDSGVEERRSYDALFLAAGTLSSLRIAADSLALHDRPVPLLDNDMYLLPVLARGAGGRGRFRARFSLSEAALAVPPGTLADGGIHIQFYSFHEYFLAELGELLGMMPELVQRVAWNMLNRMLIGFVYFAGQDSAVATARVRRAAGPGCVEVEVRQSAASRTALRGLLRRMRSARQTLGFRPLSPLIKAAPLGFSGHLSGSLAMRRQPGPLETDPEGRLHGTERVCVVDAASFPALPPQNPTFTLVAAAMRAADAFCRRVDPRMPPSATAVRG
ncbi:MAG: hypothetical protein JSV80_09435 [Acidobacteriota bacterium]|nr:MAG: hypothetical protein JSV80_09435 [Acidobacteriota bacterium]